MLECKRCDYQWTQRGKDKPKNCPNCNSRVWDKPLDAYWQDQKDKREAMKRALEEVNNG